ncbi:MAG: hypothetical protein FWD17_11010 [Polyangiaceae bacterium]|nr:hypothetical protein [Polyangiaceae bacterium]
MEAGQPAAACPKYEESLRLYDGLNTRYFLADCYARVGRTASAWALFGEVAARAAAAGDTVKEAWARERAAAIKLELSYVTVTVRSPPAAGLIVSRDGERIGPAQWGTPMPVDPGLHMIEASAPGKHRWSTHVQVMPNGASAQIDMPALKDEARAVENAPPRSRHRVLALVVGGAGVVGLGVATALAFAAKKTFDDSSADCNGNRCDQHGLDIRSRAVTQANVATVIFGVGLAGVAAGAILWLTAPPLPSTTAVGVSPTFGGMAVRGVF